MLLSLRRTKQTDIMLETLKRLPDQIRSIIKDEQALHLPLFTQNIETVVINGMGGSNLGGYIVQSLFRDRIKVPLLIEPGYTVPGYVNNRTLYIISSYSGTTEEPLHAYKAAKRRGAMIVVITANADSPLRRLAEKEKLPTCLFTPDANLSGQPRLGLGYAIGSFLALFKTLNLLKLSTKELDSIIKQLKRKNTQYAERNNEAERMAKKLYNHELILIGGQLFEGNLRTLRNQYCETAKNFASFLILPDMNHYTLEGLARPVNNKKRLAALCLESDLYEAKLKKRLSLTREVIRNNQLSVFSYHPTGTTALAQSFDILQYGSWLTYHLSLLNRVNPLEVPWVDWFKKQLLTK